MTESCKHRSPCQDRLDKAKAAGLNTVATYLPWLWHELPDGTVDLTGRTRPERDLGAFLDLCHTNGLHVIARPARSVTTHSWAAPLRIRGTGEFTVHRPLSPARIPDQRA